MILDRSRYVLYLATKLCGYSPRSPNVAFVCPGLILGNTDEVIRLIDLESLPFGRVIGVDRWNIRFPCFVNFPGLYRSSRS